MKKHYRKNPERFEFIGSYKIGLRAGKLSYAKIEKVSEWLWNAITPLFFIFYDWHEKEYVLYNYQFRSLAPAPESSTEFVAALNVAFLFNEQLVNPGALFTDGKVNKIIKFKPVFGISKKQMDDFICKYIVITKGNLQSGTTSELFYDGKGSKISLDKKISLTIEGHIKEYAEPFKDWDFE